MGRDVVAERLQRFPGENIVGAFDLLKANDVGSPLFEPGLEPVHALADGIDVPGGDAHGKKPVFTDKWRCRGVYQPPQGDAPETVYMLSSPVRAKTARHDPFFG